MKLPISKIKSNPNNPRLIKDDKFKKLVQSLKDFPIMAKKLRKVVVDENNMILGGNMRFKAIKAAGMKEVYVEYFTREDADENNRLAKELDPEHVDKTYEEQCSEFVIKDNVSGGEWDWDMLANEWDIEELDDWGLEVPKTHEQVKEEARLNLTEIFTVPPTSVIDARRGEWQKRKKAWNALIGDSGESREGLLMKATGIMPDVNNGVSILDAALSETLCKWFIPDNIDYKPKVFDCFAGDSVFGYVASYLGNSFTGVELREEQAMLNNARVREDNLDAKYINGDARKVADLIEENSQDFFFSCPPYFDLEKYSDDPEDASNQESYEDFLQLLEDAFAGAIKCLKDNRFAVVVMSAVRDNTGFYQDIPSDITRIFERNGCHLYNQIILVDTGASLALRVGNSMKNRKVGRQHQEVLVYFNGEESLLSEDINEFKTIGRQHENVLVYYKSDNPAKIKENFSDLRKGKKEKKENEK